MQKRISNDRKGGNNRSKRKPFNKNKRSSSRGDSGARRSGGSRSPSGSRSFGRDSRSKSGSRDGRSKGGFGGGGGRGRSGGFGGGSRGRGRGRGSFKREEFNPTQYINKVEKVVKEEVYKPKHLFKDFDINKDLQKSIEAAGLVTPTPVQDQSIPEALNGKDVIGLAETGTGKTAALLIPLMEKTLKNGEERTLILAPTKELAIQINKEFMTLKGNLRLFSTICVGGANINNQIKQLKKENHFIVGTPGRVLDLMKRHHIKSESLTNLVFDEADRMLDMGFITDIRKIVGKIRKERQTLFFSATMTESVKKLTKEFLNDAVYISVKKTDTAKNIEQDVVYYSHQHKFETLTDLLKQKGFERVIVFGAQKHSVKKLAEHLSDMGVKAEAIHGNKTSSQRQASLNKFKNGNAQVLVATDVVARGIHVDNVTYVINYDLPATFEDYVHRIGRTGRMNNKGKALTFVDEKLK